MLSAILAIALATATPAPAPAAPPTPAPALASLGVPDLAAPRPIPAGLWAAALILAGLAAASFALTRRRVRRARMVEVVESTSIGPRRSLVVARLGDELLLIGASEAGIALLTTTPAPAAVRAPAPVAAAPQAAEGRGFGLLSRLRLRPQRSPAPAFDSLLAESLEDLELRRKLASGLAGSVR
jgi:flagellar biogenesis protein FliO